MMELKFRTFDEDKFHYFSINEGSYGETNVEQFIFTQDKFDEDIYVGDIVTNSFGAIGEVVYENEKWSCGFSIKQTSKYDMSTGFYSPMGMNEHFNELEVIGNIHTGRINYNDN